jgi:hypothetical protein
MPSSVAYSVEVRRHAPAMLTLLNAFIKRGSVLKLSGEDEKAKEFDADKESISSDSSLTQFQWTRPFLRFHSSKLCCVAPLPWRIRHTVQQTPCYSLGSIAHDVP